jgi:cytidylate kinase
MLWKVTARHLLNEVIGQAHIFMKRVNYVIIICVQLSQGGISMNITITGDIGAGKSTIARIIAEQLNMNVIETGELYRKYSNEHGVDVLGQNKSDDWSIDRKIDSEIARLGKEVDNTIFVSRLAWYFVPNAINIYLTVNPVLAAKRVSMNKERVSEKHSGYKETLKYNQERKSLELDRYKKMYDLYDPSGYSHANIVVAIGKNTIEEVSSCIINAIKNNDYGVFIDPKTVLPTQVFRDLNYNTIKNYITEFKYYQDKIYYSEGLSISYDGLNYYVTDGHHRLIAAIKRNIKFIKVSRVNNINFKLDTFTIYDYEDIAGISLLDEVECYNNIPLSITKKSILDEAISSMSP